MEGGVKKISGFWTTTTVRRRSELASRGNFVSSVRPGSARGKGGGKKGAGGGVNRRGFSVAGVQEPSAVWGSTVGECMQEKANQNLEEEKRGKVHTCV